MYYNFYSICFSLALKTIYDDVFLDKNTWIIF
nr:MAG TPA: hypothetical protein [Microviridae sp.]